MDREVVIRGVTKKQVKLLDTMWALDSYEEYCEWKSSIPSDEQREVALLEELLLLADIDNMAEDDLSDANEVLMTFSMGNR